ncbi:hypothetical protein ABIF69_004521 [Bradyrhizobium japonicum]
MTRHSFPVYFDDNPPLDRVALAVVPMDAFSGQVVTSGVNASVVGQLARPIRNLSGQLVFINLPHQETYRVTVDPSDAGYFAPPESEFPDADDPEARRKRRHLVRLVRRPDFPFEGTTTLIRGVVMRGREPVEAARIWLDALIKPGKPSPDGIPKPAPRAFETRSGDRGAFALSLTIPHVNDPRADVDVEKGTIKRTLHLQDGDDRVDLEIEITDGKSHIFRKPIDLVGPNDPPYFEPSKP